MDLSKLDRNQDGKVDWSDVVFYTKENPGHALLAAAIIGAFAALILFVTW